MIPMRRLNRIFRPDGRALIVAMDHGLIDGPRKGLEKPQETIARVVAGGADAILTSYGVARQFATALARVGLILRADAGATSLGTPGPATIFWNVEEALRLGADALAVSAYPGASNEARTLENLSRMAAQAHAWGLAVLGEMVPGGFDSGPEYRTPAAIALSARVGAEMGADIIKTPYVEGFQQVVQGCYVPVVILGGAKRSSVREMLEEVKAAVDAGAAGVAIGRNIFAAADPTAMTAAVAAILHEDASVEDALRLVGEEPA
ncbi:MAG: class I fructose-bisphosphate aldolase [Anaerolineae bacterium]